MSNALERAGKLNPVAQVLLLGLVLGLSMFACGDDAAEGGGDGDADGEPGGTFQLNGNAANGLYRLNGDFNGDGGVSIFDFPTFAYWFGATVPRAPEYADLNGDGGVTIFDFPLFAENFGASITPPAAFASGPASPFPFESAGYIHQRPQDEGRDHRRLRAMAVEFRYG